MPVDSLTMPRLFDAHDAEWCCLANEQQNSTEKIANRRADYLAKIRRASFLAEPPDRLSLYGVAFDPGFYLATHYHDIDQFLFVIEGEFRMGRHRLHPGQGAFMPAGNPYNATVGRAGGAFLEFREIPFYRTAFSPQDVHFVGDGAPVEIAGWPKPKHKRGKTVFFDAESSPAIGCAGFGPGDQGNKMPRDIAAAIRYQALHTSPAEGYSMISVVTHKVLDVPRHRQDVDKIVYVLGGSMKFGPDGKVLRPGCGMFVPGMAPIRFSTGPSGVKFLEFRKQGRWSTEWLAGEA